MPYKYSYTFNRLSYINKRCYYQQLISTSPDAVITVHWRRKSELYLYCSKGADSPTAPSASIAGPTFTYTVTAANADTYTFVITDANVLYYYCNSNCNLLLKLIANATPNRLVVLVVLMVPCN
jgi:hypothetical protein